MTRYRDMVPYDSNMVSISTPTGLPPSTYINASMVTVKGDFLPRLYLLFR